MRELTASEMRERLVERTAELADAIQRKFVEEWRERRKLPDPRFRRAARRVRRVPKS